jgi:hypothetical protein
LSSLLCLGSKAHSALIVCFLRYTPSAKLKKLNKLNEPNKLTSR